ncbi:MAG: YfiR family protein [Holophaga sp.]|nr:YfiR family protein [Holophaga sp.]
MFTLAIVLTALVASTSSANFAMQTPAPMPEYQIKSQLIRKLLDYLDWPVSEPGRPLIVGVLEPSNLDDHLSRDLDRLVIKGRPIKLRFFRNISQITQCDAVFIPDVSELDLEKILTILNGKPIVSIADTPGYTSRGVTVNLVVVNRKVGLEVNVTTLKSSGVTLSPQVLKNATIVK